MASTTGINPWWTYEERAIPGVGKADVNVANGNLIVQSDDVNIPERGIGLSFRRTFNSQSLHDALNHDGTYPSPYGNGYTNTFDSHIRYDQATNTVTWYDIDGAAYVYTAVNGKWSHPRGQFAILTPNSPTKGRPAISSDCGYTITKKSGTAYVFDTANASLCQPNTSFNGFVQEILARNSNNNIQFSYAWADGKVGDTEHLGMLVAQHSDGQKLVLTFSKWGSKNYSELSSILLPDGSKVTYQYDDSGNLLRASRPGNNKAAILTEAYALLADKSAYEVCSPRATLSNSSNPGIPSDGDCVRFDLEAFADGTQRVVDWKDVGVVNVDPGDGFGVLQPLQPPGLQVFKEQWLAYDLATGPGTLKCGTSGTTGATLVANAGTLACDSDGHATLYVVDGLGREVQRSAYLTLSSALTVSQIWQDETNASLDNNLLSTTDARNHSTQYEYDDNGNTLSVSQPLTTASQGSLHPTSLYKYDAFNNVIAYCDPDYTAKHGTTTCPTTPTEGVKVFKYDSDGASPDADEVYGRLTDMYAASAYQITYAYTATGTQTDYGLPNSVTGNGGVAFKQKDGTSRLPYQGFSYDTRGNLRKYDTGVGTWTLLYDDTTTNMNRVVERIDPDNVASFMCYYADGSQQYTETARQHYLDGGGATCASTPPTYSVSKKYDADGNLSEEYHHHGGAYVPNGTPALSSNDDKTLKYYDGLDRLVEVQQPYDASVDLYVNPWITRYFYDLTNSEGAKSVTLSDGAAGSATYAAYGNLFKTRELLPSGNSIIQVNLAANAWAPALGAISNTQFQDIKGSAYDALDRTTAKYTLVPNYVSNLPTDQISQENLTYDTSPLDSNVAGLLGQDCNALQQCMQYDYDPMSRISTFATSDNSAPGRQYVYDADGRTKSIDSATFGKQKYDYDDDGRVTTSTDPTTGGVSAGGSVITHNYYPDGKLETVDVASSAFNQVSLIANSYLNDGNLSTESIDDTKVPSAASPGMTSVKFTLTPAGRRKLRTESGIGKNEFSTSWIYNINGNGTGSNDGLEASEKTPEQVPLANVEYNAEGEYLGAQGLILMTNVYTTRGELATSAPASIGVPSTTSVYANGVSVNEQMFAGPHVAQAQLQFFGFDTKMGVLLGAKSQQGCEEVGGGNDYNGPMCYNYGTFGYTYNIAGQMTRQWTPGDPTQDVIDTYYRSYDAENHETDVDSQKRPMLEWGPNGHPIMVGTQGSYETLHWDGNRILFSTVVIKGNTVVDDVKIGADGDITPIDGTFKGLTFYERRPDSLVMGCHNDTGAVMSETGSPSARSSGTSPCDTAYGQSTGKTTQMPSWITWATTPYSLQYPLLGSGVALGMPRPDGYAYGNGIIQGTRTYEGSAGNWTTPDAFAGDVSDPMTQKSYMWNNNNPVAYQDPSGYESFGFGLGLLGMPAQPWCNDSCQTNGYNFFFDLVLGAGAIWAGGGEGAGPALETDSATLGGAFFRAGGSFAAEGAEAESLGITKIEYTARVVERADENLNDAHHNFPIDYDREIIRSGRATVDGKGYTEFSLPGHINGKPVDYEIGGKVVNGVLEVTHRFADPRQGP